MLGYRRVRIPQFTPGLFKRYLRKSWMRVAMRAEFDAAFLRQRLNLRPREVRSIIIRFPLLLDDRVFSLQRSLNDDKDRGGYISLDQKLGSHRQEVSD